jgi:hypothetical protein
MVAGAHVTEGSCYANHPKDLIAQHTKVGKPLQVQVFENALFLFFTHPFDVGDIVTYESKRYTVCKIKLQYVCLERSDNAHVIVPIEEMRTARIHNITRSAPFTAEPMC